ncbi:MAG: hypothetical protein ABGW50_00900 [Thermococcus sp.]
MTAQSEQVGNGGGGTERAGRGAPGTTDTQQDVVETGHGGEVDGEAVDTGMEGGSGEVDLNGGEGKETVGQGGNEMRKRKFGERKGREAMQETETEVGRPT